MYSRRQSAFIFSIFLISTMNILFMLRTGIFSWSNRLTIYNSLVDRNGDMSGPGNATYDQRNLKDSETISRLWQQVGTSKEIYVYSAYYKEEENIVKLIGIALRNTNVTCSCIFDSPDNKVEVLGELDFLPENQNKKYSALYIKCPLHNVSKPTIIGITAENMTKTLQVIYTSQRRYNFTVCLPCLHGPYRNYFQMIETLEADMMFGAEFFIVYNLSASQEVNKVLRYYVEKGKMIVLPWNLPTVDVHYFGQLSFLHDCILSSRHKSKYLILKDFDELIVPHKHTNWNDMMAELEQTSPNTASHVFLSSFFHLNWGHDVTDFKGAVASETFKLNSLLNVWREKDFFLPRVRSKTIVLPDHVIKTGIHFTRERTKGYKESIVDPGIAYLHHYRNFKETSSRHKVKDDTMRKYADRLIDNVDKTLTDLGLSRKPKRTIS